MNKMKRVPSFIYMDGTRFFEKYKDKLLRETYKFIYFKKTGATLASSLTEQKHRSTGDDHSFY